MTFDDFDLAKTGDGLLPVVVQDSVTLRVLMLGYMNREAFDKTLATGLVTFWSRGRECLWTKGETSGNTLTVVDMFPDCDRDTLLVKAIPAGPTCHRGTESCFDTPGSDGFIRRLSALIRRRHEEMPEGELYHASLCQRCQEDSPESRRGSRRECHRGCRRQPQPFHLRGLRPDVPLSCPSRTDGSHT